MLKHISQNCILWEPQEFAFDLAEVMGRIEEMRLYIAVISAAPVASDGSCSGDQQCPCP